MRDVVTRSALIRKHAFEFAKQVSKKLKNCPNIEQMNVSSHITESCVKLVITIKCRTEDFARYAYLFLSLVRDPDELELDKYVRVVRDEKIVKVFFTYKREARVSKKEVMNGEEKNSKILPQMW
ncbi:MAG: hypothetical protein J7K73_01550 [Nanoarchaeota archaeon]|nr:hypothetical protein [Nanoarchaeota archaeon]